MHIKRPMVLAYHSIFCAYGFWLPNDPRGSWSEYVAAWELFRFGKATGGENIRRSVAHAAHDREKRKAAKRALKYPAVVFDGKQARAVGRGFGLAVRESGYKVLACSIMPEHVHLVVRRHRQSIERMVGHLKGRGTRQLFEEGLHPSKKFCVDGESPLTAWAEKGWNVYLNSEEDVRRAIRYVEQNPVKEGKPRQVWTFIAENAES